MSTKEELVKILQDQGFDMITACGLVEDFLSSLHGMDPGKHHFLVGEADVTIQIERTSVLKRVYGENNETVKS